MTPQQKELIDKALVRLRPLADSSGVSSDELKTCREYVVSALRRAFGERSHEQDTLKKRLTQTAAYGNEDANRVMRRDMAAGAVKDIETIIEIDADFGPAAEAPQEATNSSKTKVFIVHGHDMAAAREVEAFIGSLKLEPIILQDQPNLGQTLIEKFEANSDVGYAVVLMTPDDVGASKPAFDANADSLKNRPRQNVVMELGFFVAKLRRKHVAVLYSEGLEKPSDIDGVAYIPLDGHEGWKFRLQRELKAVEMVA